MVTNQARRSVFNVGSSNKDYCSSFRLTIGLCVISVFLFVYLSFQTIHVADKPSYSIPVLRSSGSTEDEVGVSCRESVEALTVLKQQLMPLPCVEQVREAILNDKQLNEASKALLLFSLDKLTYEKRNKWLSTLNPLIIDQPQLSNIRRICPAGSIALVVLTNGISNNVQEWLVYHLLMGVQKIMIFDDSVPESIEQVSFHLAIQPFVDLGYVVIHDVPESERWHAKEIEVNNYFLQEYGSEYEWVGFIGSDEFIVLHQKKCLTSFLSNYTDFGGVVLQWRIFSPVGVPYHDQKRTHFEQYQYTQKQVIRRHVKSIVQPKYVKTMHQHHATYKDNWAVNFRKDRVDGPFNAALGTEEFSVAELRHFWLQDMQFAFFEKVCGLSDMRNEYRDSRIQMVKGIFHEKSVSRVASPHLPLIHNDLVQFMFNDSDKPLIFTNNT